jgi:hypothetical protein
LAHHYALRAVDQSPKDFAFDGRCQDRNDHVPHITAEHQDREIYRA